MHFSEDDLRAALKRKDPGEPFTQRILTRIHRSDAKSAPSRRLPKSFPRTWLPLRFRAAPALGLVACLALVGWLGLARYRQIQERRAGERASQQAILALRITTVKLNHVFERVKASPAREIKTRRESL